MRILNGHHLGKTYRTLESLTHTSQICFPLIINNPTHQNTTTTHHEPFNQSTMASKMASIDPAVAEILDRTTRPGNDSEDEDDLISALEEEDDKSMAAFREQRLQQLHGEFSRAKEMRNSEYGTYTEIKEEKQVMDITTGAKLCVVHFMKPDFTRCRVMDEKLEVRVIPGVELFSKGAC